jgi:LmbE family N-acetylglucosaminyl deacetylase
MKNNVLIIAAHPDDEVLGCGGTIAKHVLNGDNVCVTVVCEGDSHRNLSQKTNEVHHTIKAAKVLGVKDVKMLGFKDQKLDTYPLTEIISPLEKIVNSFCPKIVYCQYGGDVNRDHELLFKALMVAVRPTMKFIESIYAFETSSSTEWAFPRSFIPDTWIDISETLELKLKAMACYETELRDYPHPRSLISLEKKACAWGNQVCIDAAEVFMTVRRIIKNDKTSI